MDTADRAGLHRVADVRAAPGSAAVVAGAGPPPAQARITAGLSGDDRGAAVPHDDQAVCGERLQGMPDDAGADALQGTHLGDRRQLVARGEDAGPDGLGQRRRDLLPGRAGSRGLIISTGTLRCSVNGLPVQDRSPQRLSSRVQLVEDGAAHLPHLHVPQGGLDRTADESLVGLPRGHVPLRDRRVLVQERRHGRARLGRAAFRCFLEQPAELDAELAARSWPWP